MENMFELLGRRSAVQDLRDAKPLTISQGAPGREPRPEAVAVRDAELAFLSSVSVCSDGLRARSSRLCASCLIRPPDLAASWLESSGLKAPNTHQPIQQKSLESTCRRGGVPGRGVRLHRRRPRAARRQLRGRRRPDRRPRRCHRVRQGTLRLDLQAVMGLASIPVRRVSVLRPVTIESCNDCCFASW